MNDEYWTLLDTETTGFAASVFVVELAPQRMRGWKPDGEAPLEVSTPRSATFKPSRICLPKCFAPFPKTVALFLGKSS